MKSFFHIIAYIDLYEDNIKLYNVGFLKWDFRNNTHYIEISLKDVTPVNCLCEICLGEERDLENQLNICEGRGWYKASYEGNGNKIIINQKEVFLEDVENIKITLDQKRHLCGKINIPVEKNDDKENNWKKNSEKMEDFESKDKISTENIGVIHRNCGKDCALETSYVEKTEANKDDNEYYRDKYVDKYSNYIENHVDKVDNYVDKTEKTDHNVRCEGNWYVEKTINGEEKRNTAKDREASMTGYEKENHAMEEKVEEEEERGFWKSKKKIDHSVERTREKKHKEEKVTEMDKIKVEKPLPEDKWNQLCLKYNVVHPFVEEEGFLTITPKDFIILQEGYQKMVHNSFLLHGYYNYGHVILGKLKEEKDKYYIGVPGVYYEQEKRAARMFGFVGFEGVEKIVENGSYGYYMIEVKI